MLEALEMRLAAQRAHVAAFQTRLASRFVNGRRDRVARYLAVAQKLARKPLRVCIAGELNSGKTELANLILGVQLLPTSVINNTLCPTVIRYGEAHSVRSYRDGGDFEETDASELHRLVQREGQRVECDLPLPLLRSIEIVDLPSFESLAFSSGFVAPLLWHSDLVIWCSQATRAWTASEKGIWLRLPTRLKNNCLFILTHADKLSAETLNAVAQRVSAEIRPEGGLAPIALAIPLAIAARSPRGQIMNSKLWKTSGGEHFFKKLSDVLQTALGTRQSRIERNTNRILQSVLSEGASRSGDALMLEWATLQPFFACNGEGRPEDVAAAAIQAVDRFRLTVLEPWLVRRNCLREEAEAFLDLLPMTAADLGPATRHRLAERLPLIFQQLTAEIDECRLRQSL